MGKMELLIISVGDFPCLVQGSQQITDFCFPPYLDLISAQCCLLTWCLSRFGSAEEVQCGCY